MNQFMHATTVLVIVAFLAGCNSAPRRDPEYSPSYPAAHQAPSTPTGSIYQAGHEIAFFEDLKARRIGDVLTVVLNEATNAKKSADTEIDRTHESTITNPTILGATPLFNLPGALPLNITEDNTLASSLSSTHAFEGESESGQSNSLTGNITVTVADVFPNGNLFIRGEKRINLNQGNEYIKISGIVRPIDIAPDNTIASNRIADATIIYNGDGVTADSNKMGWLSRFFVSAVFPF